MVTMSGKTLLGMSVFAFCRRPFGDRRFPWWATPGFAPGNAGHFGGTVTVNVSGTNGAQGLVQFDLTSCLRAPPPRTFPTPPYGFS